MSVYRSRVTTCLSGDKLQVRNSGLEQIGNGTWNQRAAADRDLDLLSAVSSAADSRGWTAVVIIACPTNSGLPSTPKVDAVTSARPGQSRKQTILVYFLPNCPVAKRLENEKIKQRYLSFLMVCCGVHQEDSSFHEFCENCVADDEDLFYVQVRR